MCDQFIKYKLFYFIFTATWKGNYGKILLTNTSHISIPQIVLLAHEIRIIMKINENKFSDQISCEQPLFYDGGLYPGLVIEISWESVMQIPLKK